MMLIDSCGVCDRSDAEKLLGDKPKSPKSGKSPLSIPCLIKQPLQPEQKGIIRKDLGDSFVVYIPSEDSTVTVPKLLVYPDFSGGVGQLDKSPSKNFSPSTKSQNQTRRRKGEGSGSIHWRTVIRNGKEYQQAYYHYKLNGKKRTKYIPQKLLGLIQEAESHKLPIADILNLLGEKNINPSKSSNTNFDEKNKINDEAIDTCKINPSKIEISPIPNSAIAITQKCDRLTQKSRYIPKRLVQKVERMNNEKVPVEKILKVLQNRVKSQTR